MGAHSKGKFCVKYWRKGVQPKVDHRYTKEGAEQLCEILSRNGYQFEVDVV